MRVKEAPESPDMTLLEGKRICIVEDDPLQLAVLRVLLKRSGAKVTEFRSGLAALEWLESKPVDIILVDVMLPDVDGWEVCAQVRERGANQGSPILFTTCVIEEEQESVMSDPTALTLSLAKPLTRERLFTAMERLLTPSV